MALTEVSGKPAPANFKSPKVGNLVLILLLLLIVVLLLNLVLILKFSSSSLCVNFQMGEELERYKLEWVVTSSTPVLQFRVEWKMVGREKSEWQSEIVEVRKKILFLGNLSPNLTPFLCKIKPNFNISI